MTEDEKQTYAIAQREACRPMECTLDSRCWVALGTSASLSPVQSGPRCLACNGRVLIEEWRTPTGLKLPPHGRLNPRARPREPNSREVEARQGDSGRSTKGYGAATPASGAP